MPLHPQVDRFLKAEQALGQKPIERCTPDEFRELMRATRAIGGSGDVALRAEDRQIDGPDCAIPIRIYQPENSKSAGATVYFHGGGWVGGDLDTHDALCRSLSGTASCSVIAVDYRLAPEHPYPAAAEDAYAAYAWARNSAEDLNISPEKIAVCGDSAGGNLAAVVCLMARDRNFPLPCSQTLIYPAVNSDFTTSSYQDYAEGYSLTASGMKWFWNHYASDETVSLEPYAVPLIAEDLSILPPALVITAEYDVLRDEGKQYAARLQDSDVTAEYKCYEGMIHGFVSRVNLFDAAQEAVSQIAATLQRSFDA